MENAKVMKIKFDVTYDGVREIRFCAHQTDNPCPEKPLRRTLFLSGVPPWANESGLERIFSQNGKISKVYLSRKASSNLTEEDKRNYSSIEKHLWPIKDTSGFKFGYIVYEKEVSMKKALKMDLSHPFILSTEDNPVLTGAKKWKREYNEQIVMPGKIDELKNAIETFVQQIDDKREEARNKAEEEAEADDDGWVTVSTKSKKRSTIGAGKSDKVKARLKAKEAKKRKNKELRNFYKFQVKEGKLEKLQELRDKFEGAKEKQRKMITERRFKPQ
eukprot:08782.XXX_378949_378047_1 [CDS] Oithona nana genome sequencing.